MSIDAQSIILSWKVVDEFHKFLPRVAKIGGVMGILGGLLYRDPCDFLIPRKRR